MLSAPTPLDADNWVVHGQTTFVSQYAPPFHAPYRGANSLDSNAGRETWDATLYIGRRLWDGAELWIDPEIDQGFGLSNTLGHRRIHQRRGLQGRLPTTPISGCPAPSSGRPSISAATTEKVEADINQFAGSQTAEPAGHHGRQIQRLGPVRHDQLCPRSPQAIFSTGRWSMPAPSTMPPTPGGSPMVRRRSGIRATGRCAPACSICRSSPTAPSSIPTFDQFQIVSELEHRHELWGQPGMLAVDGFLSRGRMGRFDDAIASPTQTGTVPNTADWCATMRAAPASTSTWSSRSCRTSACSARVGWADGNVEPYEFTDIDRTAARGLSLAASCGAGPTIRSGIAGVVNGITSVHVAYLNAGGLGILVGRRAIAASRAGTDHRDLLQPSVRLLAG